jgi:hypothetical protein
LIEINTVKGPRAGERSRLESMVVFSPDIKRLAESRLPCDDIA